MMRAARVCIMMLLAAVVLAAQAESGSSSASVGEGLVIETPARVEEDVPSSIPGRAAAGSGGFGRKGLRQRRPPGGGGSNPPGGSYGPPGSGNVTPPPGGNDPPGTNNDNNDAPLPFCRPGNGILCSDRDYTALLKANPANIDLPADAFSYAGLNPSLSAALAGDSKLDLGAGGSWATATKAALQGGVNSNLGTEALNLASDTGNTLASAALRVVAGVPDKLSLAFGKTDSSNSVERRSAKPQFWYVLGQNFGLPIGASLAKDGVFGKK